MPPPGEDGTPGHQPLLAAGGRSEGPPPSTPPAAVAVSVARSPSADATTTTSTRPPPDATLLARALSWARGGAAIPTATDKDVSAAAAGAAAAAGLPLDRTTSTSGGGPTCLICLEPLPPAAFDDGSAITLACACRGDMALRHRACAERWAAAKGDRTCELCRAEIANIPVPPPRPTAQADEALYAPGMGVLPGGPGFGLAPGGGLILWPPGAAALAARLPPGHPLLAALADGTLAPLPPPPFSADAAFPPPLPSGHETLLECARIAWIVSIVAVLFFDLNLSGALTVGLVVAVFVVGAARAAAAAREAALAAALAGWDGGGRVAGMGRRRRRQEAGGGEGQAQGQQAQQQQGVGADAV